MNGHAQNGEPGTDHKVVSFRPAVALNRVKPANDNRQPLARRILRILWSMAIAAAIGWVLWVGLL